MSHLTLGHPSQVKLFWIILMPQPYAPLKDFLGGVHHATAVKPSKETNVSTLSPCSLFIGIGSDIEGQIGKSVCRNKIDYCAHGPKDAAFVVRVPKKLFKDY